MFHNCEGQSHKTVSTDPQLLKWKESRSRFESWSVCLVSRPYWLTRGLGRLSSFNRAVQSQLTTNVCGLPSGVWVYGDRVLSVHSHLLVQQRQPNCLPTRQRAARLEGRLGVLVRAVIPWYCRTWSCVFHGQRLRTVMVLVLSWYLTRNGTIVDAGIGVSLFLLDCCPLWSASG